VKEAIQSPYIARFESFEVNLRSGELLKSGERIKLPEQSFQILAMLLEKPGEVVIRQEIQKRLWPNDTVVEFENSINAAIKRLRVALGDSADEPRYIETLARRGYRWKIPVERVESSPAQPQVPVAATVDAPTDYSASRLIGKRVSHYRVLELLGGGGMGVVYKAEDIKLGRRVALKFLPEELAGGAAALERFEREARAASALNDPNICTIYEVEEHEGQPFIVMELLEGQTLRELISSAGASQDKHVNKGLFRLEKLLDVAMQISSGLGAAHKKGTIHRDIKPANIFVTTNGQVKILDFGLAKLQHSESAESETQQIEEHRPNVKWNPYVTLTRTGVAIGTAGYMSPEQIRGEKLDARTDLFSFGLVLYEMAAGQRAFTGDTAPVLENAILHHPPAPVRELNRTITPKLETIINKALEKDREKRYQNISELRSDLEIVKREISPRNPLRWWKMVAGGIAALLVFVVSFWFAKHQVPTSQGLPDIKLQQLTDNSPENPVAAGEISPDGKYLAYTDTKGVHIKLIGSDERQTISQPEGLKNSSVVWDIAPWFPDSRRFLVHTHPSAEDPNQWSALTSSVWVVSVLGGAPRKLRDNALAWDISPDGSSIAFTTNFNHRAVNTYNGEKEIWLMAPDGGQERKLVESDGKSSVCCLHFFRDGQRIAYGISDKSGDSYVTRDLKGGSNSILALPSDTNKEGDGIWLPDGKRLYSDPCAMSGSRPDLPCNFWIKRVDLRTGKVTEAPRRLTNWFGFAIAGPSATADGKRVAFLEAYARGASYVADLEMAGTRLANLRRVTFEEGGEDGVTGWTADSNTLILVHNHSHSEISKQSLGDGTSESVIVTGEAGAFEKAFVSPDGKWIIAQVFPANRDPILLKTNVQVMRVPLSGGIPELIFSAREGSSAFCARPPSNLCAVAEPTEDQKEMTITAFDPVKGRGSELARFNVAQDVGLGRDHLVLCDISPDGSRFAVARSPDGPIEIHFLRVQKTLTIPTTGLHPLRQIAWAADGRGIFVATHTKDAGELLHLDLRGKANGVWKCTGPWQCSAIPSPDGRHLAIYEEKQSANMWMMENF